MGLQLSRYYSITSLIGIIIVVAALSIYLKEITTETLISHKTNTNTTLAKTFINAIWDKYADFIRASGTFTKSSLMQKPELIELQQDLHTLMRGSNVIKVKIYNNDGLTIFSTDPSQIGVDKHDNPSFISANTGKIRSELSFRNQFYRSDKIIVDRNLLSTYLPIKNQNNDTILAVFELYTDVTDSVIEMNKTHRTITVGVTIVLSLLYLFLLAIVRRAGRIIKFQENERLNQEKSLHYHAFYDSLTGLFNRTSFSERLKMQLHRANDQQTAFALLHIDIDRFKLINDSLGNDAGDSFLRIAANKLKQNFRGGETAFRMGGDEFLVILEGIKQAQDCVEITQNIIHSFQTPVKLNGQEIIVTVSIGISIYPNDDKSGDRLVKEANMAMIQAKESGRNNFNFYSGDMNTEALERLEMVSALQKAHNNKEFELHYQPKICSKTKQIVAVEALLRWQHPTQGMVPPIKFIPILEETGLITPVSEWIFHTACEQNKRWQNQNLAPIQMAVNVSAQHFKNNLLVPHIKKVLLSTNLDPIYLDLELTESMFIDNIEAAIKTMHLLKELGVFLSVDDFGSGFSSLSYLKRFPIDCLKIDRIFIDDISNGGKDATITSAIIALAHSLKLKIVAEGVENEQQVNFLTHLHCHELQGFYFSRPIPAEEMTLLLQKQAFPARVSSSSK